MAYFRKQKFKTTTRSILAFVRRVEDNRNYKSFVKKNNVQKWTRAIERKIDADSFLIILSRKNKSLHTDYTTLKFHLYIFVYLAYDV